jgi:hypothetical protein
LSDSGPPSFERKLHQSGTARITVLPEKASATWRSFNIPTGRPSTAKACHRLRNATGRLTSTVGAT